MITQRGESRYYQQQDNISISQKEETQHLLGGTLESHSKAPGNHCLQKPVPAGVPDSPTTGIFTQHERGNNLNIKRKNKHIQFLVIWVLKKQQQ